jgi:hypothetical protein
MRLYLNDALIHPAAEERDVLAAFADLRVRRDACLELRRSPNDHLLVSRDSEFGFALEIRLSSGDLIGAFLEDTEHERATEALREYCRGLHPKLLADGDDLYDPDCPLCADLKAHRDAAWNNQKN